MLLSEFVLHDVLELAGGLFGCLARWEGLTGVGHDEVAALGRILGRQGVFILEREREGGRHMYVHVFQVSMYTSKEMH